MSILADIALWVMILAALCLLGGIGMGPKQNINPPPTGPRPMGRLVSPPKITHFVGYQPRPSAGEPLPPPRKV